jgi:hypothetical protein
MDHLEIGDDGILEDEALDVRHPHSCNGKEELFHKEERPGGLKNVDCEDSITVRSSDQWC